jgi:Sec-independent protein translocase protein TatA
MISMVGLLLLLGLIVFGPKKTIEMAQQIGRIVAQVKQSAGEFQQSALEAEPRATPSGAKDANETA